MLDLFELLLLRGVPSGGGGIYMSGNANAQTRATTPSYTDVLSKWNALVEEFPRNIAKESIGTDSGGNTIYAYTINSHSDQALLWAEQMPTHKKILWLSGIHGHESTVPYDDFLFFHDLVKNHKNSGNLQWLWDHCTFVVVPVICPWGLDHGSRVNANGVNLNRNFPEIGWVTGEAGNNYPGSSAGSEPETQAIMALVNSNRDALFALNRHTMNNFSPTSRLAYISTLVDTDADDAFAVFEWLDGATKNRFPIYDSVKLASDNNGDRNLFAVCESTEHGTLDKWFNQQSVRGFLLEVSPNFDPTSYPSATPVLAQNVNAFVMGNFISGFAQEAASDGAVVPALAWEPGVVGTGGNNVSNAYRIRTAFAVQIPAGTLIKAKDDYQFKLARYSSWTDASDYNMVEHVAFRTDPYLIKKSGLYRIAIAPPGSERISDDIPAAAAKLTVKIMSREDLATVAVTGSFNDLLPAVSSSDNGKVLTVVDGKWQAVTPS